MTQLFKKILAPDENLKYIHIRKTFSLDRTLSLTNPIHTLILFCFFRNHSFFCQKIKVPVSQAAYCIDVS